MLFPQVPCTANQRKESIRCWAYGIASHRHILVLTVEWGQETGYSGPVVTQPFLKWSQSPLSALNSRQSGVGMKGAARILSRRVTPCHGSGLPVPSDLVPSSHLLHLTLFWGHGTASSAVVVSYDMPDVSPSCLPWAALHPFHQISGRQRGSGVSTLFPC